MASRRHPRASVTKTNAFHASLSPPLWKDQLRQRCIERLKQNRHELLAKLRSPDANIAHEMTRLVFKEEQREGRTRCRSSSRRKHPVFDLQKEEIGAPDDDEYGEEEMVTIEDLMLTGKLSEQDYLDIVHSLEDELRDDWDADQEEERFAQEMMEFEEASLAAMLQGMDLDGVPDFSEAALHGDDATVYGDGMEYDAESAGGVHVLCPICKVGSLRETQDESVKNAAVVACGCGFEFRVKNVLHGALEDLQEKISDAFMAHRGSCFADPTFAVLSDLDGENEVTDSLLMSCSACGHECLVR